MDFQALLNHHEAILQAHHNRFEEYKSWLKAQNTTPSIVADPDMSVDVLNYEDVLGGTKGTPRKNESFQGPRSPLKDNQNMINSPVHHSPNSSMRRSPRQIKESVMNLHNQGKAYDAHKQELRAKKEQEELSNCKPFTVNTDYQSHRRDSRPVHERLQAFERERKARLEKQRKESIKDDPEASFKPQLSKKALALGHRDVIGQNAAWLELRRKRIEEAKTQQMNKELECVTNSPGINGRSQKIIARKQRQISVDPKPKEKTKEKILLEEAEKYPGTPKITTHAANLQRPGTVGDRLYEQWLERQERDKHEKEQAIVTSQYSPHITKMASTLTRTRPVEDEILARHFLSQVKWEENRRQNETISTYKPVINPVSNEIANRLPQSSVDRLTSSTSSRNNTPSPISMGQQASNNSLGSSVPNSNMAQLEKVESLYLREERRKERLDYMRQQRNDDIMVECTFQPNVHRKSEPPPSAVQYYSQQPIYDRVIQWAKRREQRLEDERHRRQELDLEECTFNPDIRCISGRQYDTIMDDDIHSMNSGSTYSGLAISDRMTSTNTNRTSIHNNTIMTGTTDSNPPWGYQEFIQRQNEARERREELQQKSELFQGHTWRNEITKPQPFQLGKPYSQPIKSLQPPTTPRSTSPTYSNKPHSHNNNSSILTTLDNGIMSSQGAFSLKSSQLIMESTTPSTGSPYGAPHHYFVPSSRSSSCSSPSTMERDLSLSEYVSDSDDAWRF